MKEILEPFAYKTIQEFARIVRSFSKSGYSMDDFEKFAKKEKEEAAKDFFEERIDGLGTKRMVATRKSTPKDRGKLCTGKKKPVKPEFLKPGETILLPGVVCEKCHGEVYIEGLCRNNPLSKQGFVRRGICGNCGAEFNIR
jgi:hypothetical protein